MALFLDHFSLAREAASLARRKPEFRLMPEGVMGGGVIRLAAVVESQTVVRRPGSSMFLVDTKKFILWPRCDADGVVAGEAP